MAEERKKYEETINLLKKIDTSFAVRYDEVVSLMQKSRTHEGKDIQVTIIGVSPIEEDKENFAGENILSKVTIVNDKETIIMTIPNLSSEQLLSLEDDGSCFVHIAKIEKVQKRLIGSKKDCYYSRVARGKDYFIYYGCADKLLSTLVECEETIGYNDLFNIAEIDKSHIV